MCLIWFVLLATNIAAPPFINLLAEINIICCILSWDFYLFNIVASASLQILLYFIIQLLLQYYSLQLLRSK